MRPEMLFRLRGCWRKCDIGWVIITLFEWWIIRVSTSHKHQWTDHINLMCGLWWKQYKTSPDPAAGFVVTSLFGQWVYMLCRHRKMFMYAGRQKKIWNDWVLMSENTIYLSRSFRYARSVGVRDCQQYVLQWADIWFCSCLSGTTQLQVIV